LALHESHQIDEYIDAVVVDGLCGLSMRQLSDIDEFVASVSNRMAVAAVVLQSIGKTKDFKPASVMELIKFSGNVGGGVIAEII
jgi:hypothetical protein